ncbi:MAG TPA: lipopolysaccharide biosynthesis protein [Methanoregulaceae archaeon]|nr:lipopolysaccharide biosynthesis protein [Methanoregulaceae archaeon]
MDFFKKPPKNEQSPDTGFFHLDKIFELGKDTLIYGVANASQGFVGLFLLPLYTRTFTPYEYGVIEVITIITALLTLISGLQIESGVSRYYYERDSNPEQVRLVSTGLFLRLLLILPLLLVLLPNAGSISFLFTGTESYSPALCIAFITVPFSLLFTYFLLLLRLQKRPRTYAIIATGNFLFMAVSNIFLILVIGAGITGIFISFLVSYGIFSLCALWFVQDAVRRVFSSEEMRNILFYSIPVIPAVIASYFKGNLDKFLLIPLLGLAGLGLYSIGIRISSVLLLAVSAFNLAWTPFAMSLIRQKDHQQIYANILLVFAFGMIFLSMVIALFSKEIIHIMTPPGYWHASAIAPILLLAAAINGMFTIVGIGLNVVKKTYLITVAFLAGLACGILMLFLLVPQYGILGAGIAAFLSSVTGIFVEYRLAQKYYFIKYDVSKIALFVVTNAFLVLLLYLADGWDITGFTLGVKIVGLTVFSAILVLIFGRADFLHGTAYMWNRVAGMVRK